MEAAGVHFDENYRLRVFDPEKYTQAQRLEDSSKEFVAQLSQFNDMVKGLTQHLTDSAKLLDKEKLKAIGQRNKADNEQEQIKRQQQELYALINEKAAELERYKAQYESLVKVEAEQKAMIERLSNAES
eukprot:TRINITY_DN3739_c0_g1_i2.p1 TRINITY_DN3739_c0_g1~~TRINITY_DN3739_c0_g1_i2.p1  ORF type:complete len:129 (-),score=37.84 TRINITY_DN3739_c0_g1_i2:167-553(-)